VACTAETDNLQASQISERNHSVHFEWKFLCTFLFITNRLCLASVHIDGQAMLLAAFMAEYKSLSQTFTFCKYAWRCYTTWHQFLFIFIFIVTFITSLV